MVRAGDPTDVPSVRNLRDRAVRAASRDEIGDGSRGPAHTIADDEAVGSLAVDDDAGGCTDDLVPVDERLCRAGEHDDAHLRVGDVVLLDAAPRPADGDRGSR